MHGFGIEIKQYEYQINEEADFILGLFKDGIPKNDFSAIQILDQNFYWGRFENSKFEGMVESYFKGMLIEQYFYKCTNGILYDTSG